MVWRLTQMKRRYSSQIRGPRTQKTGRNIFKFSLGENGQTLGESTVFAECSAGLFDGFRFDTAGRLWSSAADGVHCYDADGTLIGKILIPEMVANLCFGGAARNRLFIAGTASLYAAYLNVNGA